MLRHLPPVRIRRMAPRDPHEPHRVSTPLELFFDLCFVVAVARAAAHLHHALAEGHALEALGPYAMVFFSIWWAWMNFTWFASAYDCEDGPYRLGVFVQMVGVLLIAAGVPRAFEHLDFTLATVGYTVMRAGLIAGWVRAALSDPPRRRTALRYALGVALCQLGWIAALSLPTTGWVALGLVVLLPAELLVPMWAERAGPTRWHPHHIAERYGLLALIVIGESVLSASGAIQAAFDAGASLTALAPVVVGGLLSVFAMWWLYFDRPVAHALTHTRAAFVWGYGHLFVYAAIAAVGAAIAAAADAATGHATIDSVTAARFLAVPLAAYVLLQWMLHHRAWGSGVATGLVYVGVAIALPLVAGLPLGAVWVGVLVALLAAGSQHTRGTTVEGH